MTRSILLIILTSLIFSFSAQAKVYVSSLFGDHMVLQQKSAPAIWGRSDPGEMINVTGSWDGMSLVTYADSKGKWRINLLTPEAGGPYTIKVESSNVIEIKDVMIGEVWLASGQSNMEWKLSQSDGAAREIPAADHKNIRLFKVAHQTASTPRIDVKGNWAVSSPESAEEFGAVAYYFAKELQKELNVPIGIIQSAWGGTPSEAWTSREALEAHPSFQGLLDRFDDELRNHRNDPNAKDPIHSKNPTTLYNAMIAPLIPFEMQGVIWYQGESNASDPWLYRNLFPALIYNWRHDWNKLLSFYFVQLAPYNYGAGRSGAGIREAQMMSLKVPQSGMAVTLDIGDPEDIHPTNKHDVGKRLALWALAKDYKKEDLVYSGPLYQKMEKKDGKAILHFDHIGGGLMARGGALTHFEIAGADQKFVEGKAIIENNMVVVSSDQVSEPEAVRYAFGNTDEPNLFNKEGLPASSFRTDTWPIFYVAPSITPSYNRTNDEFLVKAAYSPAANHDLFYTLDGSEPTRSSTLYKKPFLVSDASEVKMKAFSGEIGAPFSKSVQLKKHLGMYARVESQTKFSKKYSGGGEYGLLDGLLGTTNFNSLWKGFEGKDFEVVIDLGSRKDISMISTNFLQSHGAWIFLPQNITYSISKNGKKYKEIASFTASQPTEYLKDEIKNFSEKISENARFVKITAKNLGSPPNWHIGKDGKAWLMIDEVVIE